MNNYTVYKLTFPNGKIYIGQTKQKVESRWGKDGSGYRNQEVYEAIQEFGWNNVEKEVLCTNLTLEEANFFEKYYIKEFNTQGNGYNKNGGGRGDNLSSKEVYLNRLNTKGRHYVNFSIEDTFNIFDDMCAGELKVYFYLCAQVPNTYDGKNNPDCKRGPFILSPQAIKNVYPSMDIKTIQSAINKLIDKGFMTEICSNLYQFDDLPLKYRVKTEQEYIKKLTN